MTAKLESLEDKLEKIEGILNGKLKCIILAAVIHEMFPIVN